MILPVAIVIPVYNEERTLSSLLYSFQNQTKKPKRLIFCDAGSSDKSVAIIENWWKSNFWNYGQCDIIKLNGAMPGAARNAGLRASNDEWIAFIDCGIYANFNWLELLYDSALISNSKAAFGICKFSGSESIPRAVCALTYGYGSLHDVLPASLFHKSVFYEIGYFDEKLRAGEDLIWLKKFDDKYKIRNVCNDAIVHYRHFPTTFLQVYQKWKVTEFNCVIGGIRTTQHIIYISAIPLYLLLLINHGIMAVTVFLLYMLFRGLLDPIRRSHVFPWWRNNIKSLLLVFPLIIILDSAKIIGIIKGLSHRAKVWLNSDE